MFLAAVIVAAVTANPGVTVDPHQRAPPAYARLHSDAGRCRPRTTTARSALRLGLGPRHDSPLRRAIWLRHDGTTQSGGGAGWDRVFTRGLCFGANRSSSTTAACFACLSAAADDVTAGCGGASSRHAGVLLAGCFLAYIRGHRRVFGPRGFTRGSQHDGTAADCFRCLDDSARAAYALGWWQRIHGEEVIVVGYSCFLRVLVCPRCRRGRRT